MKESEGYHEPCNLTAGILEARERKAEICEDKQREEEII